jgi:large subunit ribosomal protein L19e
LTNLKNQRRLSASLLKCGRNRVRFDPERIDDVSKATTREDVRHLIQGGAIKAKQKQGISSFRKKKIKAQKDKGRRRGPGSKKGGAKTRSSKKREWIKKIRALRSLLKGLRESGAIDSSTYRRYYKRAGAGEFYSKAQLKQHLKSEGVIKNES